MARDGAVEAQTDLVDKKWVPPVAGALGASGIIIVSLMFALPRIWENVFGK